jgi:hypothetical protein
MDWNPNVITRKIRQNHLVLVSSDISNTKNTRYKPMRASVIPPHNSICFPAVSSISCPPVPTIHFLKRGLRMARSNTNIENEIPK